jgi:DNA-binding NtrC family response regulator
LNLLSRIRKLTRRMPVIVLTGHAGPDEMREALELGAAKIVRKPFQIDKLLAEVRDALGGAEGES